ncbi:MAG: GNAT family N-acetyltransferase [Rhodospirillales bacterium]
MPVAPLPAPPAGKLRQVVTWLEMTAPPWGDGPPPANPAPCGDVAVVRFDALSVADYRALQRLIGEAWLWWERLTVGDAALAALLADPGTEIRRLTVGGTVAGFSELDRRRPGEVELSFFGVAPPFIGLGLGRYLLAETLAAAWAVRPRRVWLHTCDHDHPQALGFYGRAGFRPYRRETVLIDDPRRLGLLPLDAAPHVPLA